MESWIVFAVTFLLFHSIILSFIRIFKRSKQEERLKIINKSINEIRKMMEAMLSKSNDNDLANQIQDLKVTTEVEALKIQDTLDDLMKKQNSKTFKEKKVQTKKAKGVDETPYKEIKKLYNEICVDLPKATKLSQPRKRRIHARWQEKPNIQWWKAFFMRVQDSNFLTGRTISPKYNFKASFDWIMKQSNFIKINEGQYDNRRLSPNIEKELSQLHGQHTYQ